MSRFIFLLILLLFFMTSCNIEKSSIHTLSPDKIQVQEKEVPKEVIESESIKDFGSGFTLSQTDDETTLSYSGKTIKSWSHTPPEKVPFTWDEACENLWDKFEKLSPSDQSTGKQGAWESLGEDGQKACMKEYFWKNALNIKSYDTRFYKIYRTYYGGSDLWLYDTVSGNMPEFSNTQIGNIIDKIEILPEEIRITTSSTEDEDIHFSVIFDKDFMTMLDIVPVE